MVDEPPVGAFDPLLDRPRPDRVAPPKLGEHPRVGERARKILAPPRPASGQGAVELASAGRFRGLEDHTVQTVDPLQPFLGLIGRRSEQVEDLVDERRSGRGAALLVGAPPAKPQALGRAAGAGVEQVALLGRLLLPDERRHAEAPPPLVPQQGIPGVAAGELAVLERGDEQVTGSGRACPVRAQHPNPSLGWPPPQWNPDILEQLERLGGSGRRAARHGVQLGEVGEGCGRRRCGAKLERRERHGPGCCARVRIALDGLAAGVCLLGELVCGGGQGSQPLAARAGVPKRGEHPGGRIPVGDQLVRRARLAAQQAALDPVADPLRLAGAGPHEGEQLLAAGLGQARARERAEAASGGGSSQRHRRLDRDRDPESLEHAREQGPVAIGMPQDHGDAVRRNSAGEQPGDLAADGLGLAALAAAFEHRDPIVGLHAGGACLEQVSVEVAQRGALRVAVVEGKLALLHAAELVAKPRQQHGPGSERLAVLVVDGDRDRAGAGQRRQQLELLLGQVVEPVQKHRTGAPGARSLEQAGRDLAKGGMGIVAAGSVPHADVGLIQPGELGLVGAILELRGRARERAGGDPARLEL